MALDTSRTFEPIGIAIATISDTRTAATDRSGDMLAARVTDAGHRLVDRAIVTDDADRIVECLAGWIEDPAIQCIISTGGTGLTGRDVTPEAVEAVCDRMIPGFGELFRWISMESIGVSTIQSRACGGLARGGTFIFALPGSPGAVADGWDRILVHQLDSRFRPCNFVELMPRLSEV
jgi:molybdenum cofactor biosynthesis protein B